MSVHDVQYCQRGHPIADDKLLGQLSISRYVEGPIRYLVGHPLPGPFPHLPPALPSGPNPLEARHIHDHQSSGCPVLFPFVVQAAVEGTNFYEGYTSMALPCRS